VPHLRRSFIALKVGYLYLRFFRVFYKRPVAPYNHPHDTRSQALSILRRPSLHHLQLLPAQTLSGPAAAPNLFEQTLERIRLRYQFGVVGYVVMPEYVHLLLSEPNGHPLAKALHALKLSVSKLSPPRPFWQSRYCDFNVFSARKHIEKLRYIHRNPVKRGLVAEPMHWRWSSFRHYVTGERGTVEIESFWTAAVREKEYENCKRL
jgi:putative transposase